MPVYLHCSIHICSVFDHFGYKTPDLNAWNHLTWYSEDRTLQWLQALRAELNPHHIRGHEFCHREADQSTLAITRAIMDRVSATVPTQVVATSTSSALGSSTTSTPSELVVSGRNIPSGGPFQFVTTDSDNDSDGIPQIFSEDEATPSEPSNQPPVPKLILKRKLKKKTAKAKGEDQAPVKAPKLKKRKKTTATKSSAKVEKLIVKLPPGQQQLPFSQQLQTMAAKQAKSSGTSEASHRADNSSSSDTQGDGDSTHPSSSGDKTT